MKKKYNTDFECDMTQYDTGAMRSSQEGKGRFDLIPSSPLFRLAQVYERGGKAHGDRNWEKGFPICRAIDSAIRHILQFKDRRTDEDHLMQAVWNIFAAAHLEEMVEKGVLKPETDDRPIYEKLEPEKTKGKARFDVIEARRKYENDVARKADKRFAEAVDEPILKESDFNFDGDEVIEDLALEYPMGRREPELAKRSEKDRK